MLIFLSSPVRQVISHLPIPCLLPYFDLGHHQYLLLVFLISYVMCSALVASQGSVETQSKTIPPIKHEVQLQPNITNWHPNLQRASVFLPAREAQM